MKKMIWSLVLVLLFFAWTGAAQASPEIFLDGKEITSKVPPVIENGRTLVPLRVISESLGADVEWDAATNSVTVAKPGITIQLFIGGEALKNGSPITLDVPAKIIRDKTFVPLRFVSETLGAVVSWDETYQSVIISSPGFKGDPNAPVSRGLAEDRKSQTIIAFAKQHLGVPYVWGGRSPKGFDCSGFTSYVFSEFGINLPRTTYDQFKSGTAVTKLKLGDLVFFSTYDSGASHVGIYIGNDQFIHASSGSSKITITSLSSTYYKPRYLGARRVVS